MVKTARVGGLERRRSGELSGGEAQEWHWLELRDTAPVLFADEPTGSLDSLTGEKVMDLLVDSAHVEGTTVFLVTHDARVAAYADREVFVRDGKVTSATPGEVLLMFGLGLHLTIKSGREALVRLILTAVAVALE